MRTCRSCSPRPKAACLRTCSPDCCKPCCLPRRRCHSLSPRRPGRLFYKRQNNSPCDPCESCSFDDLCRPYNSSCLPRSRKYRPRICSPCRPRSCYYRERYPSCHKSCVTRRCDSPLHCKYLPFDPCDPCARESCLPRTCEPCVPRRDPCFPRKYDPCDPCYSPSRRPSYRRKWESSCYPLKCDPCYPVTCDPCYTSRPSTKVKYCLPRKLCEPCSPCYSPLRDFCTYRSPGKYRPRYCLPYDDTSDVLGRIKVRDLTCDKFRKVCYPKALPIKSCTVEGCMCDICNCNCVSSKEPACEVAKVDAIKSPIDEGPSLNFLQKSRRLGNCKGRYDPHLCPWEADVSISGTVRGHCTSTAVEVARRMSGTFRAEGDRFTSDSRENKKSCTLESQRMTLGKLDDGTSLNFSRNNDPSEKLSQNRSLNFNKPKETSPSPTEFIKSGCRRRRNRRCENQHGDHDSCFPASCRENSDCHVENMRPTGSASGERRSVEDILKDQKPHCSRRSSHHSVRFGSDNDSSDYQSASEKRELTHPIQDGNSSCSEVQRFLKSRKDQRRRNRASSPARNISKNKLQKSPPLQRPDHERCLGVSPASNLLRRHKAHNSSRPDSPLFTSPTHCSRIGNRDFSALRSSEDLDNISLNSLHRDDSQQRERNTECREISLESDRIAANRRRSFRNVHCLDSVLEDTRHKDRY